LVERNCGFGVLLDADLHGLTRHFVLAAECTEATELLAGFGVLGKLRSQSKLLPQSIAFAHGVILQCPFMKPAFVIDD